MTAIMAPTINAYKRFIAQAFWPWNVTWGHDNRTVYVRIPAERGKATRIENRAGDGTANAYLAAAAALFAGIDGLDRELDPGEATRGDAYAAEDRAAVPFSLAEALDALEADEYLTETLGPQFVRAFVALKRDELKRFASSVTEWGAPRVLERAVTVTEFDPRTVDLANPDTFVERIPYEYFDWLRANEPVYWHPEPPPNHGFWVVTRHDDLVAIHRDFRTFSSEVGHVAIEELQPDELRARQSMLETDPPKHTRWRRIVSQFFTPRAVGAYEDFVRDLARELVDAALPLGEFDFVDELSAPYPINVLVRILGAPSEDAPKLVELGDRMIANTDPDYSDAVVDREDTSEYRLLTFRSPAAVELAEYGAASQPSAGPSPRTTSSRSSSMPRSTARR